MKVKELAEQLKDLDPELEILLQDDDEGNGYRPLRGVDGDNVGYNGKKNHHSIQVGILQLTSELKDVGYSQEDICDQPCAVLY